MTEDDRDLMRPLPKGQRFQGKSFHLKINVSETIQRVTARQWRTIMIISRTVITIMVIR